MATLTLYSTSACHLCEQAMTLIAPLLGSDDQLDVVDISDSDQLMQQYGIRIPVVKREDSGAEIGWPFDRDAFIAFLDGSNHSSL